MKRKQTTKTKPAASVKADLEESKDPVVPAPKSARKSARKIIRAEPDLKTVFQRLLNVFSAQGDGHIIGRSREKQIIVEFLNDNIDSNKSGLLYICGHPG